MILSLQSLSIVTGQAETLLTVVVLQA